MANETTGKNPEQITAGNASDNVSGRRNARSGAARQGRPDGVQDGARNEPGGDSTAGRQSAQGKIDEGPRDNGRNDAQADAPRTRRPHRSSRSGKPADGGRDAARTRQTPGNERQSDNGRRASENSRSSARNGRKATDTRREPRAASAPPRGVRWTWRDYALQLSVVVIGIVVTFAGSGLIERWRMAREVRATMLLVHAELESNRADFKEVWDYMQWETRACRILTENRSDLKRIPADSLASFSPIYGRIHFFRPRKDAFEVLKNSGLMSSVSDKDFLLTVTQGYAVLADLEENVSMYYKLKLAAQNDMSRSFSREQRERFYTGGMYEMWACIFSVPDFAEFMLTAPYYFPEGYIEGLSADVDRAVQAIEAKYELNKKRSDD